MSRVLVTSGREIDEKKGGPMKRLLLIIALMACLPVFAQDQPRGVPNHDFWVYRVKGGYRITAFQDQLIVTASSLEYVDRNVPSC
jgi:hypothetical protein